MKHTEGPWQYSFESGTVAFIVEQDGTTIAKLSTLKIQQRMATWQPTPD